VTAASDRVHVLVADDEPHLGRIVQLKLEQGPFRVTIAYDGQETLDALGTHDDVRLLLLDLMMPRVSGLDVLAAVRGDVRWRDLPVVVLTAAGEASAREQAAELGATDVMTKPFSPKRLFARVAELTGTPLALGDET
jgi:DNA-binding response OmpR family regulator